MRKLNLSRLGPLRTVLSERRKSVEAKNKSGFAKNVKNVKQFHHGVLKLEALEACYWLKATGFSEYVHLYEDKKFPISISFVEKEHDTLDEDSRQSLIRRLETLNRCSKLIDKRFKNSPLRKIRLKENSEASSDSKKHHEKRQCFSESSEMLNSSGDASSTKRPPSKYGIYDVNTGPNASRTVNTPFAVTGEEEPRFSRTFSFSGTYGSEQHEDEVRVPFSSSASTSNVLDDNNRGSFYDNIPMIIVSHSENDNATLGPCTSDSVFDETVPCSSKDFTAQNDSEDDLSSVSSDEDEDEEDTEHLDISGAQSDGRINDKVMGSVDSGVPSSPILRSPSVRRRRVRWHSFQKSSSDRGSVCLSLKIQNLSAGQMNVLRKISLLRLTALMERYSIQNRSGWHWTVPKLLKRLRASDNKDKNIFGSPLLTIAQRTGNPLPRAILLSMNYLIRTASSCLGIFRRSGMKSRIEKLKDEIDSGTNLIDFDSYSLYDIADLLKQYLRELPEPLLTSKLAETFISIYKDIPDELRAQAIKLAIILMPDENREALQTVLTFLSHFAENAVDNQMDHKNLSVCFTPAFFHIFGIKVDKNQNSRKLKRTFNSTRSEKDLEDTTAAQQCLVDLMKSVRFLFAVPEDVMMKCRFSYIEQGDPVFLENLSQNLSDPGIEDGYHSYLDNCFAGLLQESQAKAKGWIQHSFTDEVDISYKKVNDGYPIRLWKAVVEVNASPNDVLKRFVKERHLWDDEMVHWEYKEHLDDQTDVFFYETQTIAPSMKRNFLILRSWKTNLNGSCCGCVATSIQHRSTPVEFGIRATVLADRCLMEPCGLGRSRITYISRTDLRGKSPRYYNKAVGPWLVYSCVKKIRDTFNFGPDGPETNV